jgi:hypothetical protein
MLVRVVVIPHAVMDLPARVTALDLDRRVADLEALAQPLLEASNHVLGVGQRQLVHDDVRAQRHGLGGQRPHVKVVDRAD